MAACISVAKCVPLRHTASAPGLSQRTPLSKAAHVPCLSNLLPLMGRWTKALHRSRFLGQICHGPLDTSAGVRKVAKRDGAAVVKAGLPDNLVPKLVPGIIVIQLEPLLLLMAITRSFEHALNFGPRAALLNDRSLPMVRKVLAYNLRKLQRQRDVQGWVAYFMSVLPGIANLGGLFKQAVKEGVAEVMAHEENRFGRRMLPEERFKELAIEQLQHLEMLLEGVYWPGQDPDAEDPTREFIMPPRLEVPATKSCEHVYRMDDFFTVERIQLALEPVVTGNVGFLREMSDAVEDVLRDCTNPAACHDQVLQLLYVALRGDSPLKAALEHDLPLDLALDKDDAGFVLVTAGKYGDAVGSAAKWLLGDVKSMIESCSNSSEQA